MDVMLFGGTFDPLNSIHLEIIEKAYEKFHPDEIWLVPTYQTNYYNEESTKHPADPDTRLAMLNEAKKDLPGWVRVCPLEIENRTSGATIDLVKILENKRREGEFAGYRFSWLMGSDQRIHDFKDAEKVIKFFEYFAVFPRSDKPFLGKIDEIKFRSVQDAPIAHGEIDSTMLRRLLREGKPLNEKIDDYGVTLRDCIPPRVLEYILNFHLYEEKKKRRPEIL